MIISIIVTAKEITNWIFLLLKININIAKIIKIPMVFKIPDAKIKSGNWNPFSIKNNREEDIIKINPLKISLTIKSFLFSYLPIEIVKEKPARNKNRAEQKGTISNKKAVNPVL